MLRIYTGADNALYVAYTSKGITISLSAREFKSLAQFPQLGNLPAVKEAMTSSDAAGGEG